jgi:uncharacterized LabA/DUF88 family protein
MEDTLSSEKRVIVYIDGYNLYEGMKDQGWRKFLWLDLKKFSQSLLIENQKLKWIKYFTTRVTHDLSRQRRQSTFIDALSTIENMRFFYGNFKPDTKICDRCKAIVYFSAEKQTDVNISTQMLTDAFNDEFDTAILITGDSDQVPTIVQIRNLNKDKEKDKEKTVVVAFPPMRESDELAKVATTSYRIVKKKFRDAQLPEEIKLESGIILKRPIEWK